MSAFSLRSPPPQVPWTPIRPSDVGRPYYCKQDFSSQEATQAKQTFGHNLNIAAIKLAEEGQIVAVRPEGWAQVSCTHSGGTRWVPSDRLLVNRNVLVKDNWKFDLELPGNFDARINPNTYTPVGINSQPFNRAIKGLAEGLANRLHELPLSRQEICALLRDTPRRNQLVNTIIGGIDTRFRTLINNSQVTLAMLQNQLLEVEYSNHSGGIYIIITGKELYVGSSTDLSGRKAGHQSELSDRNIKTPKIRAMRANGSHKMYQVCVLPKEDITLKIAEQLYILALQTYFPPIREPNTSNAVVSGVGRDAATTNTLLRLSANIRAAKFLSGVAESTFTAVGWPGFILRERPATGVKHGLNSSSPVAEVQHERAPWLRIEDDKAIVFRRETPGRARIDGSSMVAWFKNGLQGATMSVNYPANEPGPPVDAEIFPVWEISKSRVHPQSWAQLPNIGPWPDWDLARQLAFRVEWEDNGQWRTRFVHAEMIETMISDNVGTYRTYVRAMAVRRYLLGLKMQNDYLWDEDWGVAHVKFLQFNYFTRTMSLRTMYPPVELQTRTPLRSMQEMINAIHNAGFANVNGPWRTFAGQQIWGKRSKCDGCSYSKNLYCIQRGTTNQCENCFSRGRPCSWTTTEVKDRPQMEAQLHRSAKPLVRIHDINIAHITRNATTQ